MSTLRSSSSGGSSSKLIDITTFRETAALTAAQCVAHFDLDETIREAVECNCSILTIDSISPPQTRETSGSGLDAEHDMDALDGEDALPNSDDRDDLETAESTSVVRDTIEDDSDIWEPIQDDEVVISIQFPHPDPGCEPIAEYLVLSSQPLTVLRDAFYCPVDFLQLDDGDMPIDTLTTKRSASYFFIENVFYTDLRNPEAEDYSSKIIDWVKEEDRYRQPGMALYKRASMSDSRFADLSVRLNVPYLLVHQGNCEHILTFREIRTMTLEDTRNPSAYPKSIVPRKFDSSCRTCKLRNAEWVTIDDMRADINPCLWCQECFDKFHFRKDGTPAFDFQFHKFNLTAQPS